MPGEVYESPFPPIKEFQGPTISYLLSTKFPGNHTAFIDALSGTILTRDHFQHLVFQLAHGLRTHSQVQLKESDTIMIFAPNSLAWTLILYGCLAAGVRCSLANPAYTAAELAYQYSDSNCKFVFTTDEGLPSVRAMFKNLGHDGGAADKRIIRTTKCLAWAGGPSAPRVIQPVLDLEDLLSLPGSHTSAFGTTGGDQFHATAFLCYSSGTTGKPKGVETTHGNATSIIEGFKHTMPWPDKGNHAILAVLPFYHIYGIIALVLFPFSVGVPCIIQERFDILQFCSNIARYRISVAFIVPPILVTLARHPAVEQSDLGSLKLLMSGAAPLGASLVKQVVSRFNSLGNNALNIIQAYGLTETTAMTHVVQLSDRERKIGSVGRLQPSLQARLVTDDDGNSDAKRNQPGEIWLRGPTIMKGYLNNAKATSESITREGWFKTGDIAVVDAEGYFYIVDRRKELIKYKGFQVAPAELESVLLTHPEVADAAVIGIDDAVEATELPRAYVVHAHPEKLNSDQERAMFTAAVASWIKTRVANHKYLRGGVQILETIPKSPSGKILRRELRERAKEEGNGNIQAKL